MENLIEKIENWANKKGLLGSDQMELENTITPQELLKLRNELRIFKQYAKAIEEWGETESAIAYNLKDDIKDGIGDVLVVLIISACQNGINFNECWGKGFEDLGNYSKENGQFAETAITILLGKLAEGYLKNKPVETIISNIISNLLVICDSYKLRLGECLQMAYDEIKDREGMLVNGTFIKKSDLQNA